MSKQHVKITSDGTGPGTHILVDGVEMDQAKAITIDIVGGELALVTFKMYVDEIELDGACKVVEVRQ